MSLKPQIDACTYVGAIRPVFRTSGVNGRRSVHILRHDCCGDLSPLQPTQRRLLGRETEVRAVYGRSRERARWLQRAPSTDVEMERLETAVKWN